MQPPTRRLVPQLYQSIKFSTCIKVLLRPVSKFFFDLDFDLTCTVSSDGETASSLSELAERSHGSTVCSDMLVAVSGMCCSSLHNSPRDWGPTRSLHLHRSCCCELCPCCSSPFLLGSNFASPCQAEEETKVILELTLVLSLILRIILILRVSLILRIRFTFDATHFRILEHLLFTPTVIFSYGTNN